MVHSSVNTGDLEAVQRQVDVFFQIFEQLLQDALRVMATQQQKTEESLRIWMGSGKDDRTLRQVYGRMANGEHRNDMTPERLGLLLNALQQPVTANTDLSQYTCRKPAIEVKVDQTTLFRQERDGIVTVNYIQQQQDRLTELNSLYKKQQQAPSKNSAIVTSPIGAAQQQVSVLPFPKLRQFLRSVLKHGVESLAVVAQRSHQKEIAQAALEALRQRQVGTNETTYQIGNFSISQQGKNQYLLSDENGMLMKFQESRKGLQVLAISDRLSESDFQSALDRLSQPLLGTHEAEYAFKVRETEQTVRDFLAYMQTSVWDAERGKFRLELTEDNQILIFSKQDNRGQVYGLSKESARRSHSVMTRLTQQDFEHFAELKHRLAEHQTKRESLNLNQNGQNVNSNGKTSMIELE